MILATIRKSIAGKLWLTTTTLMVVAFLVLGASLSHLLEGFYINQKADDLKIHGERIAQLLTATHKYQMADEIEVIGKFVNADIMVVDKAGLILACGEKMGMQEGMHLNTIEVNEVLAGNTIVRKGFHAEFKEPVLTVAIPVQSANEVIGAVLLYSPYKDYSATIRSMNRLIFYTALGAIILTTILSFFLANKISKPLVAMQGAAKQLSKGDFNVRVPIDSEDEVGSLAQAINFMAANLETYTNEISEQREKLFNILTGMSEAVVAFDKARKVILFNPPATEVLGEMLSLGQDFNEVFFALGEDVWSQNMGQSTKKELVFKQQGKFLEANLSPWKGRDGHLNGIIAVVQDITQKKMTEQIRKEFVASVSHELRTPLSFIQGYSEALLDEVAQTEEERKNYLEIINEESIRLRSLVDDLVDLNRLELGQLPLSKADVDLSDLVKQVVRKYQSVTNDANVALEYEEKGQHDFVCADAMRLQQVMINLIDNAFRHTRAGGRIRITLGYQAHNVDIKVTDTGQGIPEADLPLIWERFYKVDKARTRQGGTGLGLAIVKQIIEGHEGKINVASQEGVGTEFTITLPYKDK